MSEDEKAVAAVEEVEKTPPARPPHLQVRVRFPARPHVTITVDVSPEHPYDEREALAIETARINQRLPKGTAAIVEWVG